MRGRRSQHYARSSKSCKARGCRRRAAARFAVAHRLHQRRRGKQSATGRVCVSEAAARESIDSGHKVRLPAEGESALDKARPAPVRASRPKLCVIVPAHWEAVMGGSQYQAKMLVDHLLERDACEIYYLARRVPAERPRGYEIRQIARPDGIRRYGEVFDSFDLLACLK